MKPTPSNKSITIYIIIRDKSVRRVYRTFTWTMDIKRKKDYTIHEVINNLLWVVLACFVCLAGKVDDKKSSESRPI